MADYYIKDADGIVTGIHKDELVVEGQVVGTDVDVDYVGGKRPKEAIRVVVKIGDGGTVKDGMPVDFHRRRDYWPVLSKHMTKVYGTYVVEDTPTNHDHVVAMVASTEKPDGSIDKARVGCHDMKTIEGLLGCPGIVAAWRSGDSVAEVYTPSMDVTEAITGDAVNPIAIDRNSVSSGSYGIGSGDDYATIVAFASDCANLTGNLVGTVSSDVTETARADFTVALSTYTLRLTSDDTPNGDPTSGHVVTHNAGTHGILDGCTGSSGTVEIDGLLWRRAANGSNEERAFVVIGTASTAHTHQIHDNMVDGAGYDGTGFRCADVSVIVQMYNNVIWDFSNALCRGVLIDSSDGHSSSVYEHNTIRNCSVGFHLSNNNVTVRNNASYDNGAVDFYTVPNATGYNNASSDATAADGNWSTGSDNLTNQTAADDFRSTTDTDSTFLDLKYGGALDEAGYSTVLADNTAGIRGRSRPNSNGTYSIGASEAVYPTFTSATPNTGDVAGGTSVDIAGSGYESAQGSGTVTIDGNAASSYGAWADGAITITTPAGTVGAKDIVITNDWGASVTSVGGFTYTGGSDGDGLFFFFVSPNNVDKD